MDKPTVKFSAVLESKFTTLGSTQRRALTGASWTLLGYGISQGIRFAGTLIITRLLFPELFGLMAIVQTVLMALAMFSDVGLSDHVVRHERGHERRFLDTVFTVQVLRGIALWALCFALAPLIAHFYADQRLLWLLPVVGCSALISGFQSTAVMILRKRMALRQLTTLEVSAQVAGLCVVVSWAAISPSIWALVAGGLTTNLVAVIGGHALNRPHRNTLSVDRESIIEILSFGKWIFVSTIFTFLAGQTDRLILGKLFSLEFLGVYNIAFLLADVPRALMVALASKVIFPSLALARNVPRADMREKIRGRRRLLLSGAGIALACLVSLGDVAVQLIYDPRWAAAAWILPLLAASVWPLILAWSLDPIFFVLGRVHVPAIGNCLRFIVMIILVMVGASLAGVVGAVIGVSLGVLPVYVVSKIGLRSEGLAFFRQDLGATALFVGIIGAIMLTRTIAGHTPNILFQLQSL